MSQFNTNNNETDNIIGTLYDINSLPVHIIESEYFTPFRIEDAQSNDFNPPFGISAPERGVLNEKLCKDWQNLLLEEKHFYIKDNIFVTDFNIRSQADLDRIIEADAVFCFTHNAKIEILRNIERYWNEYPSSSPIRLPIEDYSLFANQVRGLVKKLLDDQEENERLLQIQYIKEAADEEESRAIAEETAAEMEDYEKQMADIDRYYDSKDYGSKYSDDYYYY